jgi:hypothetical protein
MPANHICAPGWSIADPCKPSLNRHLPCPKSDCRAVPQLLQAGMNFSVFISKKC